jgi:hypothetical protein
MKRVATMKTAPKDRYILAWWPYPGRWETTRWDDEKFHVKPRPFWYSFVIAKLWGLRTVRLNQPTHWAELPPEPI